MSKVKLLPLLTILAATLLAACTSPVGLQEPGITPPSFWNSLMGEGQMADMNAPLTMKSDTSVDQLWWKHFNDPTLDALISEALLNNKTLQIAKARVEEARAGRTLAQSSLLPQISGVANAERSNQGYGTFNQDISVEQVDVEATWELDLFGRNQARTAQATAILQSTEASQQAIRVALLAEVAHAYFEMRNNERQITLTQQNLETQKKTLELIQAQKQGAMASNFDVQRAQAQVLTTAALIPAVQTSYDASCNRLNVLLGLPPGSRDQLLKAPRELKKLDPQIVIAAPAKILSTRPDIKAAERNFAASMSAKDAAVASLFPDISLTALFGAQTATPFSSTPWGLGVNLVQPILNFGRIQSEIDTADAQQQQAFFNYQQTVLQALENMENALSSYIHETTRNAALTAAVAQNQNAADLARLQYTNGYTSLLDVLVVQRNLLDAQSSQAASDANLRSDLINIYTAAGGGWSE